MRIVVRTQGLTEMIGKLERAKSMTLAIMEAQFPPMAEAMGSESTIKMRSVTPVVSGRLARSTQTDVQVGGLEANLTVTQGAVSEPNPYSGRGGGFPYAAAVIGGRRAVVPITAKVLWGRNFGPSMRSGPGRANDYPQKWASAMAPVVGRIMTAYGARMAEEIAAEL